MEPSSRLVLDRLGEVEPVDGEEEIRMPAELELGASVARRTIRGSGHQLVDRLPRRRASTFAKACSHVDGPQLPSRSRRSQS